MKIFYVMISLLILLENSNANKCKKKLMFDYDLIGHYIAVEEINPFCQTIK